MTDRSPGLSESGVKSLGLLFGAARQSGGYMIVACFCGAILKGKSISVCPKCLTPVPRLRRAQHGS